MACISVLQAKVIDFATTATAIADWTVINAAQNAADTEEADGKFVYDIKQSELPYGVLPKDNHNIPQG